MIQSHFLLNCSTNPLTHNRLASSCLVFFQASQFSWRSWCSSLNRTRKRNRAVLWNPTVMRGVSNQSQISKQGGTRRRSYAAANGATARSSSPIKSILLSTGFTCAFRSRERVRKATEKRACTERDEIQHDPSAA